MIKKTATSQTISQPVVPASQELQDSVVEPEPMVWNEHNVCSVPGDGLEIRFQFVVYQRRGRQWSQGSWRLFNDGQWTAAFRELNIPIAECVRFGQFPVAEDFGLFTTAEEAKLACAWKLHDLGALAAPSANRPVPTEYRKELMENYDDEEDDEIEDEAEE